VPQNRGLQLGEEQAPLISLPDFRRPETAYASYSRRLLNAGRGFLQILGKQILHKCLNHKSKQGAFIFQDHYLGRPDLFGEQAATPRQRLFQLARSALGWQRQELVILVSALAQSFLNFAPVAVASDKFFFCARRLLASP
jgi:hypothetical protein